MSEENVEVVRQIYEGWKAGDFSVGVAAFDPHVMLVIRPEFPEFGVFIGLEGASTWMRRWLEHWEHAAVQARRIQAVGDTVLAEAVIHAKGRTSGIEGDTHHFQLFTFRGRKIIRMEAVMDESEALEAAGLSESAMSQENVEVIRRVYEAVGRDDSATVLALYDPDVEFDFSRSPLAFAMKRRVYHGYDGIRTWVRERYEAWESIDETCGELIAHGEHVVSTTTSRGRGRSSGVDAALTHFGVWTFRGGRIVRVAWFGTREEALEAAGLSE